MELLTVLATAAEGGESSSHAAFYAIGLVTAGVAVLIGVLGTMRPSFASSEGAGRGVMALFALLVVATCASAVITA
jgi:hypothetical protein